VLYREGTCTSDKTTACNNAKKDDNFMIIIGAIKIAAEVISNEVMSMICC
jgi:hypothetical protein